MPARGCGDSRTDGGIYMECGLSPFGKPLEHFIIDPPVEGVVPPGEGKPRPVMEALSLTARGVQIIEHEGVAHVFDVIGAEHYPDVLDFLEETRVLGASRRCELGPKDYERLVPGQSRMILVHPKAFTAQHAEYYAAMSETQSEAFLCPKRLPLHQLERGVELNLDRKKYLRGADESDTALVQTSPGPLRPPESMCAGLWWFDLTHQSERDVVDVSEKDPGVLPVRRKLPCGAEFQAFYRSEKIENPEHRPALFLSLPITNLVLVDPSRQHDKKKSKLEKSRMKWEVVDE